MTLDTALYPERIIPAGALLTSDSEILAKYADKADRQYLNEHGDRLIQLKEVTVQARKKPERKSSYYTNPDHSLTQEEIDRIPPSSLTVLFVRVGVNFATDSLGRKILHISGPVGNGPAMVLVDDFPLGNSSGDINNYLPDVSDIAQVDVLTSTTNLVAFGQTGGNGAIAIYTRHGRQGAPIEKLYIKKIMPLGFQTPIEFYAPKYDSISVVSTPDLRTTIHWQPSLSIDEAGKASFRFYTADTPSPYSVVIEGVADDGKIVYKREKIKVGMK